MAGPMEGIKVVELGVWVAGPAAGGILADWGADVIKIEPPTGDPARMFGRMLGIEDGSSPPFEMDNRGKRSIVLDLTTDDGRATAFELLSGADVFLTNVRPGALRRIGSGLRDGGRRTILGLVYGLITGYGESGPDADRAAYDVAAFWATGRTGASADPPWRHTAVSAGRHGRPHGGHDVGGGGVRGPGRAGAHGERAVGQHLAVPAGRLHRQLRPQHVPADRAFHRDRPARDDGQPVHEQLCGGRRTAVLDRRPAGRVATGRRCAAPSGGPTG